MSRLETVLQLIAKQQAKEKKESKVWCVGEDLKELAATLDDANLALLETDLTNGGMTIHTAEQKAIKAYAQQHNGCCPARKVPEILAEYFGLTLIKTGSAQPAPAAEEAFSLNLEDLL